MQSYKLCVRALMQCSQLHTGMCNMQQDATVIQSCRTACVCRYIVTTGWVQFQLFVLWQGKMPCFLQCLHEPPLVPLMTIVVLLSGVATVTQFLALISKSVFPSRHEYFNGSYKLVSCSIRTFVLMTFITNNYIMQVGVQRCYSVSVYGT